MICQKQLTDAPWMQEKTARLPGVQPLDMADWLQVDDAYSAQMVERARLLLNHEAQVLQILPGSEAAVAELHQIVLKHVDDHLAFEAGGNGITRPDGMHIRNTYSTPLHHLAHLVTEDFCILQKQGDEHVLTAALLCFPASWLLAEKIGHPLTDIHAPVTTYTPDIAKRVQRMFDAVQPGRALWRANALHYADPTLFQPMRDTQRRVVPQGEGFIRSERQSILRLPETGAVVFSIHTRQIRVQDLTPDQAAVLSQNPIEHAVEGSL